MQALGQFAASMVDLSLLSGQFMNLLPGDHGFYLLPERYEPRSQPRRYYLLGVLYTYSFIDKHSGLVDRNVRGSD